MKYAPMKRLFSLAALCVALPVGAEVSALKSVSVFTFAPDGTLFVADGNGSSIHAFETIAADNPMAQAGFNLRNLDTKIAELLKTDASALRVQDLAVHPTSKEAYVAVSHIENDSYVPAIIIVNQSGDMRLMPTGNPSKSLVIDNTQEEEFKFYDRVSSRSLTFTDIEYYKGSLYLSGLSNADFSSTLWTTPYPFDDSTKTSSVEIFHTTHVQQETRAPIRTLMITEIDGVDTVIAAYTCTPLVSFPLSDLKDGAHINGKTLAEMGYGNTPIDLISYQATDFATQNQYPIMLLTNKNQSAQIVDLGSIEEAVAGDGITEQVMFGKKQGLPAFDVPLNNILQVADQNDYFITTVRRDLEEGDLELVSFMKNVYLRLGDFESEYEFPSYEYQAEQKWMFDMQQQMKTAEAESVSVWKQ